MRFSAVWRQFFDEHLPSRVKARYLPPRRQSARGKVFGEKDFEFFGPSILELSEMLGEMRASLPSRSLSYFEHARYRSAYLLYWLPLQAMKVAFLLDLYRDRFTTLPETVRVLDLGAGPGTGSLAFLFHVLSLKNPPRAIEFTWVDRNRAIMEDGLELLESWKPPAGGPKVSVKLISCELQKFRPPEAEAAWDFVVAGHVLNESRHLPEKLEAILKLTGGLGMLLLEPATRSNSQELVRLRDKLRAATEIIGPCLHRGICPLAAGRDWCHTSVPIEIPGEIFARVSREIGTPREWLKFSYLWLGGARSSSAQSTPVGPTLRRVLTEPLDARPVTEILVCEPDRVKRLKVRRVLAPYRGGIMTVGNH